VETALSWDAAAAGGRRAVRRAVKRSVTRIRAATWPVIQCSIGACLAYLLARELLGHPAPVFAAVAAVVCLGVTQGQRLRRVVELTAGVTIGVAMGDVLISQIGRGSWQLGLIVGLGMLLAQALGGGPLVTAQAGLQGVFLIALPQADAGLSRWQDALLGGLIALTVAAALPGDPARPVRVEAEGLITDLAELLRNAAAAVRDDDADAAHEALEQARATQGDLDRWHEALRNGDEISRISPLRRRHRGELANFRRELVGLDRATRNLRVALRRVAAALEQGERIPGRVAGILEDLAAALGALRLETGHATPDGLAATTLRALAGRLDPEALCADSLSATVVVAQVRSTVVDLLGATGVATEEARALLPR
jgi:uncharacterized membrane protein YgaE (UPF0421/DUF939 family)